MLRDLKEMNNNFEAAIKWIGERKKREEPMKYYKSAGLQGGSEKHRLVAFINHMGASA